MAMKEKVVVLYASPYSMKDDDGRKVEGVSVAYLYGDKLESIMHPNGALGQRPASCSIAYEKQDKFPAAPALYDGIFDVSIGKDGKPMLKLVDVDFVSLVTLERMKTNPKPAGKGLDTDKF